MVKAVPTRKGIEKYNNNRRSQEQKENQSAAQQERGGRRASGLAGVLDTLNSIPGLGNKLPVEINRKAPGTFDWLTPHPGESPGTYSDQYGTGEKSPTDCQRWPDSPFCKNPLEQAGHKPLGINIEIAYTDCETCIITTYDLAWIRLPISTFCTRRAECITKPPDPSPTPTPTPTPDPGPSEGVGDGNTVPTLPAGDPNAPCSITLGAKQRRTQKTWTYTEHYEILVGGGIAQGGTYATSQIYEVGGGCWWPYDPEGSAPAPWRYLGGGQVAVSLRPFRDRTVYFWVDTWELDTFSQTEDLNEETGQVSSRATTRIRTRQGIYTQISDLTVAECFYLSSRFGEALAKARGPYGNTNEEIEYVAATSGEWWTNSTEELTAVTASYKQAFRLVECSCCPKPAPPHPPLPPHNRKMSCCDETNDKLDSLIKRLGLHKLPANVTASMTDDNEETIKIENTMEYLHWFARNVFEHFGEWPIKIQVKTDEEEQSAPMNFPNVAEALAELYGLAFSTSRDSDSGYATGIATLGLLSKLFAMEISSHDLAFATASFLGFRLNGVGRKIELPFNPESDPGTTSQEKLFKATEQWTDGYENEDQTTLYALLERMMLGISVLKENTFTKTTPGKMAERLNELVDLIKGEAKTPEDWDNDLKAIQDQINPYFKARGLAEVSIKEIVPPAPAPEGG